MFLFFSNSNSIRQNYKFLEINVILLELNRVTEKKKLLLCYFSNNCSCMQNCICYFQIQWRNGIKKNKDRVDNQTCTMVENGQKRSHFFFLFISNYIFQKPQKAVCHSFPLSPMHGLSFKAMRSKLCMQPPFMRALVLGRSRPASVASEAVS